jgi:murein DD-endopeptidase MepM/ murein hydrolase activator NlpD
MHTIIETDGRAIVLDLSTGATLNGRPIAGHDVGELSAAIDEAMASAGTGFAFGRWGEPRELYANDNFAEAHTGEMRTIHLGIDLFCRAGTPIHAPLAGVVEHAANNAAELDYGPLVILRHEPPGDDAFFTLYGHLSLETLERIQVGQAVRAGDEIATVGSPPVNGNWPPHLHFQVIRDLLGRGVDFPGVAPASERDYWLNLSPSPARFFAAMEAALLEYDACN